MIVLHTYHPSTGGISDIHYDIHLWSPEVALSLPGHDGGERHNHQKGAVEAVGVEEVRQEGDGLNGLA